jgi:hypothetical protein
VSNDVSKLNRVAVILLGVFVVVALGVAVSAKVTANDSYSASSKVDRRRLVDDYLRAVASCKSSTELRKLWNDLDTTLNLAQSTRPEVIAVHKRIHQYTDTNPNCAHLPPKPKGLKRTG